MKKIKVLVVFGTRPEAIKMCPVVLELKKRKEIECKICLTGQHREMLEQVMDIFDLVADYNLEIMQPNQTLAMITIKIMERIDKILRVESPDLVMVHGDTTSSFAVSLAAFYKNIPIGHVESGLRTYNMKSPFPEEFNRQVVDIIADYYFAPTEKAKENLLREGKREEKIFVTGNTVIDALRTTVINNYQNTYIDWAADSKLILLTAHRRENIGDAMENIFCAIRKIVLEHSDVKVIFPIHKNPKVRAIADKILKGEDRIKIIEPLNVFDFHNFMNKSYLILTDSGGIQEEAPTLGKPVLVLRNVTERPEGVQAGTLKVVGTDFFSVYDNIKMLLNNKELYEEMATSVNPYGDGHASERISNIIIEQLRNNINAKSVDCFTNI